MTSPRPAPTPTRPVARVLSDIGYVLQSAADEAARVRCVLELLQQLISYDACALLIERPNDGDEFFVLPAGSVPGGPAGLRVALDRLLYMLADEPDQESPTHWTERTARLPWLSYLAVPLTGMDRVIGILAVGRLTALPYDDDDLSLLSIVGSQLAAYRMALMELATRSQAEQSLRAALENRNRAVAELQQANLERAAFLSSVTHDLKAPLTGIRGHAQLLLRQLDRAETEEGTRLAQGVRQIEDLTQRMREQLDELLDLAHLQAGQRLELRPRPTDLVALARQLADDYQKEGERYRLVVEAHVPSLVGKWDSVRLGRVLVNLLTNAINYSPDGGTITIVVTKEDDHPKAWAVLEVRDQGLGIPAADLPHIFDRFYRGTNVTGRIKGTGIGLAGARQIIEQHGGTITVVSEEGKGSTFTIRLPLPTTGEAAAPGRA